MQVELNERKKLSQENEQLHWKIRQSFVSSALDGSALSARWVVFGLFEVYSTKSYFYTVQEY